MIDPVLCSKRTKIMEADLTRDCYDGGRGENHSIEEPHVERVRRLIEEQYRVCPTGCGTSFGEILCHELHTKSLTFVDISKKWGISCSMLGVLLADHCQQLEPSPAVDHSFVIR